MENAEEVMQMLEEFSKIRPKDIPRELEDYLSFVAKTGDPVYQWSLVKTLFREKLISVITDFYESSPTVELPPCPNVEPFNYDRLKTSLIERLDSFSSAPFTVQRICELLTCPRKEYNRVDKYMRAIEKNILVVSTCEPRSAKPPCDPDGQSETILNGMPDVKLNEADGSLLHLPTDLPYLGAPPASNDITVETSEPSSLENMVDSAKVNLSSTDVNYESKELPVEVGTEQSWQESTAKETVDQIENNVTAGVEADVSTVRSVEENNDTSDTSNSSSGLVLPNIELSNQNVSLAESQCSSEALPASPSKNVPSDPPDSIGSSESTLAKMSSEGTIEIDRKSPNIETEELMASDENEVSSTPADDVAIVQEDFSDPADSEAEATGSNGKLTPLKVELDAGSTQNNEVSTRIIHTDSPKASITIPELTTATKSDDIDLECNEISGTVESPVDSPENDSALQSEGVLKENIDAEVEPCLHPDSSDDVSLENKISSEELSKSEQCSEADSMSDSDLQQSETRTDPEEVPDQAAQILPETVNEDSSSRNLDTLDKNSSEVCTSKTVDENVNIASKSSDSSSGSDDSSRDAAADLKPNDVQSSTEADAICEEEGKHFEPDALQAASSLTPDSQQQEVGIEEISVDPSSEAEEAMEVDEGSNQMMVTEGENEGEPMDQSDQQS